MEYVSLAVEAAVARKTMAAKPSSSAEIEATVEARLNEEIVEDRDRHQVLPSVFTNVWDLTLNIQSPTSQQP